MFNRSKIALIPAITSATFVLSYWITSVREPDNILGVSSDIAGGLTFGMGIGLSMVLLLALKKHRSSN